MRKLLLPLLLILSLSLSAQTWQKMASTPMTTNVGGYWIFTPAGANSTTPCIIAMHGLGEQGSGSSTDLNLIVTQGFPKLINDRVGTGSAFPHNCIVIFPQYTGGTPSLFRMQGIIDYVKANITFDQNKLHLAGYSLGAAGVTGWWEIGDLTDVASCLIAATPSTYYSAGAANAVTYNMPTLFIHGDQDVHPTAYAYSVAWVNSLNTDGISPASILKTMPGEGHNVDETVWDWTWYEVQPGYDAIEWQLQFSRGSATLVHTLIGNSGGTVYRWKLFSNNTFTVETHNGTTWVSTSGFTQTMRGRISSTNYRWLMNANLTYTQQ
jgi:poly(3-hydroxybutyrate) depolymerase